MKVLLPFALLFLFSVNLLPAVEGQDKTSLQRSPKKEDKVDINPRQQQALLMLESAVEKARHLENSTVKVKILTQAADILWAYNESDARKLFVETLDIIDSLKQNVSGNQSTQSKASAQNSAHIEDLRSDLFQRIARHDFNLAEKLRNAIKEGENRDQENNRATQSEKEDLAWDIAIAVARSHPEQTARFVQASFRSGINPILGDALVGIRRANPQLADQLFTDAVVVARSNLEGADAIENLAEYVFPTEAETLQERQPSSDSGHAAAIRSFLSYVAVR
jgi:hypothetical protein